MEFIRVTRENLEREHICCAISGNKDCQVMSKKSWLAERFEDGLVFLKADARGKCFIEYIPGENAWAPVDAKDLAWIDCLWVSGQFAGRGYARELLNACVQDCREKGLKGVATLSADRKRPYLADPKFLAHNGFRAVGEAGFFRLYWLPFSEGAQPPRFRQSVSQPGPEDLTLYYTQQCPFTAKYVPLAEKLAEAKGVPLKTVRLESREQAQNAPSPFTAYSLFWRGKLLSYEILSEKKIEKLLEEMEHG